MVQTQHPDANVFRVVGRDCRSRDHAQAGFRTTVDGTVGIVTTLHGVVGCREVSAENSSEGVRGLEITRVDVPRDVAFLSSSTLRTDRALSHAALPPSMATVDALPIRDLVTVDQLAALADRRSPKPEVFVRHLTGGVRPQSFGAPVLDPAGFVVGMENGVTGPSGAVAWVVAFQDLEWTPPVQNETEIDRLAGLTSPLW